jgi:tripartite-type tricarboxylate transporter receptor subunit TctC
MADEAWQIRAVVFKHVVAAALLLGGGSLPALGEDIAEFYRGKQVKLLIGADPGGPYDAYARLLARHLGDHIPGQPRIVVQNMPGATSVIAANYVYNKAPQDGSVIATLNNVVPLIKVLGEADIQFDPAKLNWLGSVARELYVIYVRSGSPIRTLADAKQAKVTMGATGPMAMSALFPRLINNVVGTQFQIVTGYPGLAAVQIAMERNEVDGLAGDSWYNDHGQGKSFNWFLDGTVRTIAVIGSKQPKQLAGIPHLTDLARDAEGRRLLELFSSPAEVGKPAVMGPDVPQARVQAMRGAFAATVSDPAFVADAEKLGLAVDPVAGEELAALVQRLMETPASVAQRARDMNRR